MFASFLITFREGLEAFLLVGIILSYMHKLDVRRYNKYVYLGVALGLIVSLALAFVFQVVIDQFSNEHYQTLLMIFILLFATLVLSYMAVWMHRQAKAQVDHVRKQLHAHISAGNLWGMVFLAFIAVLREGFETVLFFSALMYSGQGVTLENGLIGAALGLMASIVLVWAMMRGTRQVPIAPFFKYTSLLIIIIAAGLFSSAINMLQAIDVVPVVVEQIFNIAFILDDQGTFGTFMRALFGYNASPTLIQFASWALYLGLFLSFWSRGYAKKI
ncbi:FTR1 family iron permease [Flexibacterium corallicola]|uniref:FTR1 family iron permease n=1 Tax=Flexibacterium corallicola TaxID=3037259 RepID=UPI00286EFE24|nr:FTR1 family protein [Pseudovibrio sp. M1P-2-3]